MLSLTLPYLSRALCDMTAHDVDSGASCVTMVPDCKNIDMPCVVSGTAKWVRELVFS